MSSPSNASEAKAAPTEGERKARLELSYPRALYRSEWKRFLKRRAVFSESGTPDREKIETPPIHFPENTVGVALSGGGIRSATFCLGVFQAMARKEGVLQQIDFMSTVSGGGYFGSFLGVWINRARRRNPAGSAESPQLKDPVGGPAKNTKEIRQEFEKVERGLADSASFEVDWLRNNGRYLAPNGGGDYMKAFANLLRNWLAVQVVMGSFLLMVATFWVLVVNGLFARYFPKFAVPIVDDCVETFVWNWSPAMPGVLLLLAVCVFLGAIYWFPGYEPKTRSRLTGMLGWFLTATIGFLLVALIDSTGLSLWENQSFLVDKLDGWTAELGGAFATFLFCIKWVFGKIKGFASEEKRLSVPKVAMVSIAALVIALVWVVGVQFIAYGILRCAITGPWWADWVLLLGLIVVCALFSLNPTFLNLSSQATLYTARLSRAYLGASNPERRGNLNVTDMLPGDVVTFPEYSPDELGGPLHLVNVTVNETVDGISGIEQNDRKGFNLAVGPSGLSAAVRHHALWTGDRLKIDPVKRTGKHENDYNCFGPVEVAPENLDLGRWVSISGAAFTTGLGARTAVGLSFLLGFLNVRLGHWWKTGVVPSSRGLKGFRPHLLAVMDWIFPVQQHLFSECLARFPGSARRRWYLSDGGHFENTAAYELIRRRLPLIIMCDDGADPKRFLDDYGNLVRKARTDFETKLEIVAPGDDRFPKVPGLEEFFGSMRNLCVTEKTGFSKRHAILVHVEYTLSGGVGWLIVLKPGLTGDEPADVINYWRNNPDFPQEPTSDQFYDEAQWESYRRLGQHVCEQLLGFCSDSAPLSKALGLAVPSGGNATT